MVEGVSLGVQIEVEIKLYEVQTNRADYIFEKNNIVNNKVEKISVIIIEVVNLIGVVDYFKIV